MRALYLARSQHINMQDGHGNTLGHGSSCVLYVHTQAVGLHGYNVALDCIT